MNDQRTIRVDGDHAEVIYDDGTRLTIGDTSAGQSSDEYHTIDELYRHRALLTAAWFCELAADPGGDTLGVHRSRLHSDGTSIPGFFIVMANLPTGQISYHYPNTDWELFATVPEWERAAPWDKHTSADVVDRIERFLRA